MHFSSTFTFNASPDKVEAMLLSPDFAAYCGERMKQLDSAASAVATAGDRSIEVVYTMATPPSYAKFVGATAKATENLSFGDSHQGQLTMSVAKVPAKLDGTVVLTGTTTTTATLDGDFAVKIPFVGGKIEERAVAMLSRMTGSVETFGNDYLASH